MARDGTLVTAGQIERSIYLIRGEKVMLDADLATLYEIETGALVRAVKRNAQRFPAHFMFQLTKSEWEELLRCQSGISKGRSHGGRRYAPYAFTEHGVAMLSSVLRSSRAIQHRRRRAGLAWLSARVTTIRALGSCHAGSSRAASAALGRHLRLSQRP